MTKFQGNRSGKDHYRRRLQQVMAWGLPALVLGGLAWPRLGLVAGGLMLSSLVVAFWKSRLWCGWVCPRGSFLERWLAMISFNRPIPGFLLKPRFRWSLCSFLMTVLAFRLMAAGSNLDRVGLVFVMLCLVTSVAAIALGVAYKARTWCTFCPMGTLQGQIGKLRTVQRKGCQ